MTVFILGKDARYEFLRELLVGVPTVANAANQTLKKEDWYVRYGSIAHLQEDGSCASPLCPHGTKVSFLTEHSAWRLQPKMGDKILVFNEMPFETKDLALQLMQLRKSHPNIAIEIVIYEHPRTGMSSDIDTPAEACEQAIFRFEKGGYPVFRHIKGGTFPFLFWGRCNVVRQMRTQLQQCNHVLDVAQLVQRCQSQYDRLLAEQLSDPSVLDWFTRYHDSFRGKNVIVCYHERVQNYFFELHKAEWITPIVKSCEQFCKEIAVWDMLADEVALTQQLEKALKNKCAQLEPRVFRGENARDYDFFLNETKIKITFDNLLKSFFETGMVEILVQEVRAKQSKLEELLK